MEHHEDLLCPQDQRLHHLLRLHGPHDQAIFYRVLSLHVGFHLRPAAVTRYRAHYPQEGFPASLSMQGRKWGPLSCSNAGPLDESTALDSFIRNGYAFHYRISGGSGICPPSTPASPGTEFVLRATPFFPGMIAPPIFAASNGQFAGMMRALRSGGQNPFK